MMVMVLIHKLRLLDSGRLEYEQLTLLEAKAIGSFLSTNVPEINHDSDGKFTPFTDEDGRRLLSGCPVYDLVRVSNTSSPNREDMIFISGEAASFMLVVITGKVAVLSGLKQFRSDAGPWSVLCAEALTCGEKGRYIPDFNAFIATDTVRCIKITREQYEKAKAGEYVFRGDLAESPDAAAFDRGGRNSRNSKGKGLFRFPNLTADELQSFQIDRKSRENSDENPSPTLMRRALSEKTYNDKTYTSVPLKKPDAT